MTTEVGFLRICGNVEPVESSPNVYYAELDVSRFSDACSVSSPFLLLEGANQFAVRVGRRSLGLIQESHARVLPVSIRSFEAMQAASRDEKFRVVGETTRFGNSAVVHANLTRYESTGLEGESVARAEVLVMPVNHEALKIRIGDETTENQLPHKLLRVNPIGDIETLLMRARVVKSGTDSQILECVAKEHALFRDHFQDCPIIPASLMLELVFIGVTSVSAGAELRPRLHGIRFMHPIRPNSHFFLHIEKSLKTASSLFRVYNAGGTTLARGEVATSLARIPGQGVE